MKLALPGTGKGFDQVGIGYAVERKDHQDGQHGTGGQAEANEGREYLRVSGGSGRVCPTE